MAAADRRDRRHPHRPPVRVALLGLRQRRRRAGRAPADPAPTRSPPAPASASSWSASPWPTRRGPARSPSRPRSDRHRRRRRWSSATTSTSWSSSSAGSHPAHELVEAALRAGKPVVTGNKALLAVAGAELAEVAADAGVDLLYEAAVAGAIPVIRPLRESLAGEQIVRVMGIVNGTTNYILTRMEEDGDDYDDALARPSSSGWPSATRRPTSRGTTPRPRRPSWPRWPSAATSSTPTCTARASPAISAADVAYASRLGYSVKLLAVAELVDGGPEISVRVHPAMVPRTHPLASVRGAFNAVFVEGAVSGELMLYGRGAGRRPDGQRRAGRPGRRRAQPARRRAGAGARSAPSTTVRPQTELRSAFYLSMDVADRPGRPGRGGQDLRRPRRLHPGHGAGRAGRGGPADLPHPRGPGGRPAGHHRRAAPAPGRRPGQRRAAGHRRRTRTSEAS